MGTALTKTMMSVLSFRFLGSILAGASFGYAYHRAVGCRNGACLITGNPYIATLYGAVLGFLIGKGP